MLITPISPFSNLPLSLAYPCLTLCRASQKWHYPLILIILDGAGQMLVLPVVSVLDLHHVGGQLPGGAHVDGMGADLDGLLGLLVK